MMRVSIIIPVYNAAPYLGACLDSVLANNPYEIICVDDGSTDGSAAILDEYMKTHACLKVIHQSNMGVSVARNRGLDMISGDWFGFVDADDLVEKNWFEIADGELSARAETDLLAFGQDSFDEQGRVGEPRFAWNKLETGFTQVIYRRDVFGEVRFPLLTHGEDRVYFFRCLSKSHHLATRHEVVYHYRMNNKSASHQRPTFAIRRSKFIASGMMFLLMFRISDIGIWHYLHYGKDVVRNLRILCLG